MTTLDDRMRAWAHDLDEAVGVGDPDVMLARIEGRTTSAWSPRRVLAVAAVAVAVLAVVVPELLGPPTVRIAPVAPSPLRHAWSAGPWPPAEAPAAVDGWVRVPADVVGDAPGATVDVTVWRGGFVRIVGAERLRVSADGIAWTDLPAPPVGGPWMQAVIADASGHLVVVGSDETGAVAYRTSDGAVWEALSTPDVPGGRADPYRAVRSERQGVVVVHAVAAADGGYGLWRLRDGGFEPLPVPDGFRGRAGSDGQDLVLLAGPESDDPYRARDGGWEPLPAWPGEGAGEDGGPVWIGGTDGRTMASFHSPGRLLVLDAGRWVEPVVRGAPVWPGTDRPAYTVLAVARIDGDLHLVGGALRDPDRLATHEFAVWRQDGDRYVPAVEPGGPVRGRLWAQLEFAWPVPTVDGTTLVVGNVGAARSTLWVHRRPTREVSPAQAPRGRGACSARDEPVEPAPLHEEWIDPRVVATRAALARAAATCDLEQLASLAGPGFVGADGQPVADVAAHLTELEEAWTAGDRPGPGPLLALRRLVELPPAEEVPPSYRREVARVWPYLGAVRPDTPAPWAVEELVRSGLYDRATLASWGDIASGPPADGPPSTLVPYQGWRVELDAEGRWIGFVDGEVGLPDAAAGEGGDG